VTNASGSPEEERLRFIKHKGHAIYLIDFKNCKAKELLLLLDQVRSDIARHEPGSVLTLAEFEGAEIDKQVATRMKEVLVLDRPYVKRSAWVGRRACPRCFMSTSKTSRCASFRSSRRARKPWSGWYKIRLAVTKS